VIQITISRLGRHCNGFPLVHSCSIGSLAAFGSSSAISSVHFTNRATFEFLFRFDRFLQFRIEIGGACVFLCRLSHRSSSRTSLCVSTNLRLSPHKHSNRRSAFRSIEQVVPSSNCTSLNSEKPKILRSWLLSNLTVPFFTDSRTSRRDVRSFEFEVCASKNFCSLSEISDLE